MVSIKKFLFFAIMASVLIGAVCVKADKTTDPEEAAKEETSAEKPEAAASGATESAQSTVTEFGKKIISGFKSAGKSIFSHIPFLSHGAAKGKEGEKESEAAPESKSDAEAGDAKPEAKEEESKKSA